MKNLKIGMKLLVIFGVILTLLLATIVVSIGGMQFGSAHFREFYEYSYPMSNKTIDVRRGLQMSIKALGLSMLTDDPTMVQNYVDEVDREMSGVRENLEYLRQNFQGDTGEIEESLKLLDQAKQYRLKVEELSLAGKNKEAAEIFFADYNPTMLKVKDLSIDMSEKTAAIADDTYAESRQAEFAVILIVAVIGGIAVITTIALAAYATRGLTQPIAEIEKAAKEMAQGHLNVSITYESKDELGSLCENMRIMTGRVSRYMEIISSSLVQLANGDLNVVQREDFLGDFRIVQVAVRKLIRGLNDTLTRINQSADQVALDSEQVATGSQALSQGATEQACSMETLSTTIRVISQQIQDTAQNASDARKQTTEAGTEVNECNQKMREMIDAMQEISSKSAEIGKIIKTIEDIAFQTNILALNAAVEAARAGAAGKGFAVVADEVRNLASKSAEASKNTSSLIEGTVSAVEKGTKIAGATAQSLELVVETTKATFSIVEKIAKAAEVQTTSIVEVTQGIGQISEVVQTNSATAEESAAASQELSGQSQMLKSLVSQFKLKEAAMAAIPANTGAEVASIL